MKMRWMARVVAAALLPWCGQAAGPTLTIDSPDGRIVGQPGQTVSWRFTLTNPSNYLFVTSVAFVPNSSLGVLIDSVSPENPAVRPEAPSLTRVVPFRIDRAAPAQSIVGKLVITYNLYARNVSDPAFNPDTDLMLQGATIAAGVRVDIVLRPASQRPLCPNGTCDDRPRTR